MRSASDNVPGLPPDQEALRARCFHPTGAFIEFKKEEIEQSVPDRFEDQVRKHTQRIAVKATDGEFTYGDLNKAANRTAHAILAMRGAGEAQVALLSHQSASTIAATLGVMKAGKVYVPLDPAAPSSRNRQILEDAQTELLVTDEQNDSIARALAQDLCPVINTDGLNSTLSTENPGLRISPDRLGYIMYTSGSTGNPKGVVQSHRNVLHKCRGWTNLVHMSPADRLSQLRSPSVSGSVRDLFGGLLSGAAVIAFNVKKQGTAGLTQWLAREKITIYNSVATLLRSFGADLTGAEDFSSIRLVKLSGETVYRSDVEIYRKYFPRSCLFLNMLASAEVGSIRAYFAGKDTSIHDNVVPVGYPLEECEVLLLDNEGHQLGFNETGEIAIRSRFLSPGYWRRPDLTDAAFLPDPEGGDARIFRTGDLGQLLADGCLVARGRKDLHVKIRGYSVEIAEIEAALLDLDGMKTAVVTTKQDAHGNQALVAHVVLTGQPALTSGAIRKAIAAKLPDYMVPSAFVVLDSLPLTGPGKVNLQALPEPGPARPDLETAFASPRTPIEKTMVGIWLEVLHMDQVGIYDNFFDLGGDSLQAGRIISRVMDVFRIDVPLRSFFETPTVAEIAAVVEQHREKQAT